MRSVGIGGRPLTQPKSEVESEYLTSSLPWLQISLWEGGNFFVDPRLTPYGRADLPHNDLSHQFICGSFLSRGFSGRLCKPELEYFFLEMVVTPPPPPDQSDHRGKK